MDLKNVEDFYPLSPMQEGMLFHSLYAPGSGVYCEQAVQSLRGTFYFSDFKRAWQRAVERHAVLRTAFVWDGLKEPIQVVHEQVPLPFEEQDWRGLSPGEQGERLAAFLQADRERGFELSNAPLMRFTLVQVAEETYQFIWSYHHLLLDGWSVPLILKEVFTSYEAFCRGQEIQFQQTRPFKDYIKWLKQQDLSKAENYWRNTLKGFIAPTTLSVSHIPTASANDAKGDRDQEIKLSPTVTASLKAFARQHRLTLNTLVQGAWVLVLARYSNEENVVFGATVSGRPAELAGVESMIGLFINTLPVRVQVSGEDSILPWLLRLQKQQTELRQYEYTPLVKIQEWSKVRPGLFDSILIFENFPTFAPEVELNENLKVGESRYITRVSYPLAALVKPDSEMSIRLMYDSSRFDDSVISRILGSFQRMLEGIPDDPDRRLTDIPFLTEAERHKVMVEWNATQVDYPKDKSLGQLFEEQAGRTPEATAVGCRGVELSYGELNRRVNQMAGYLRGLGVRPGVFVGICMERSVDMVVGLLGVLKAGGAYVPLDPGFPKDRLEFMLEDSGAPILLTQLALSGDLSGYKGKVVCVDTDWERNAEENAENPEAVGSPEDLAYVIYTSGSTGKPKGVQISQRAVVNFLYSMRREPGLTSADTVLSVTTISFDIFGLELYLPLITGARVVLVQQEEAADGARLADLLRQSKASVMQATPATWRLLLQAGWEGERSLRIFCGGEALPRDLVDPLLDRCKEFWNLYGPTETTIWSTVYQVKAKEDSILIGHPIANTQIYILDKSLRPTPLGVAGELHIGGDGLARGYWNRPELTAEKFIADPFSEDPKARIYKTGDLARYRPDGSIECLGRIDHQVKVRGFRIELGEIEATLAKLDEVSQCAVAVREDRPGDQRLVAYYVAKGNGEVSAADWRNYLHTQLPDYMVPQHFVKLEAMPLTPNGKVDRKAFPKPDLRTASDKEYVAPRTGIERTLADVWQEVLGIAQVGTKDDFFELGGHSLIAVRLMSKMAERLKIEMPLHSLLEARTIERLAELLIAEKGRENLNKSVGLSWNDKTEATTGTLAKTKPRTSTERRLSSIWERILNIKHIGIRDSFIDLQGDSNLFDSMLAEVRSEFGVFAEGLPIKAIYDEPTIEALARTIDDTLKPPKSLIVNLQPRGSKRPLFLIHAGGGYVFFYRAIAYRLGQDRPVYAVRAATSSDGNERPFDKSKSIEDLATRYIVEIKTIQPKGPYFLGGASLGGVIAFEMARQLESKGEELGGPLLLFSAIVANNLCARDACASPPGRLGQRIAFLRHRASGYGLFKGAWYFFRKVLSNGPYEIRKLVGAISRKFQTRALEIIENHESILPRKWKVPYEVKQQRIMKKFMEAAGRLLFGYTPGVFKGSVVLFKASHYSHLEQWWAGLAHGGMTVHKMPGDHLDMLEEPTVIETAALVSKYLNEGADYFPVHAEAAFSARPSGEAPHEP